MADHFDIDFEDAAFKHSLERFTARIIDLRPFWPLVVPLFIGWMRSQFESEGEFGGHPWPALSEEYEPAKARKYPGKGLLVAEGDLRQAASRPHRHVTGSELILTVDWGAEKGEPVDLAWHQEGTTRMPARPLLFGDPLPIEARSELDRAAELYVEESIRHSGLRSAR